MTLATAKRNFPEVAWFSAGAFIQAWQKIQGKLEDNILTVRDNAINLIGAMLLPDEKKARLFVEEVASIASRSVWDLSDEERQQVAESFIRIAARPVTA